MEGNLLKKFDLFVFDWDGTLSKSIRIFTQKVDPFWKYKKMRYGRVGRGAKAGRAADVLVTRHGSKIERRMLLPIADISLFFIKPSLYPDAKEVLEILKKKGKRIVLFTNGASYRVLRELKYLGLVDYFDAIVSAQDLKALKPNPQGLEIAVKRFKVKKSRTLYIGDMVDDVMMARFAKARSCALAQGFDKYEILKSSRPDYLFRDIRGFRRAL